MENMRQSQNLKHVIQYDCTSFSAKSNNILHLCVLNLQSGVILQMSRADILLDLIC